jgi:Domain of unknown function (DUF4351)
VRLFTQLHLGKVFRKVINNTLRFEASIEVYSSIEASSHDMISYNQPLMHVDRYDPNECLEGLTARFSDTWPSGIYQMAKILQTSIVAINELPSTEDTLWLRLLGRGKVQKQAIEEVLALPAQAQSRIQALQLLTSWKITLEVSNIKDDDREAMMALSQAYIEWEQRTVQQGLQQGEQSLIIRLLTQQLGTIPEEVRAQIERLSIPQLEQLADRLLNLSSIEDLTNWLQTYQN